MFNRAKAVHNKAKGLRQKQKDATDFFSDPKNLKLFQQVDSRVCLELSTVTVSLFSAT